ncbi:transmembrane anchor protein [Massilia sp. NP310]|uniref:transmembrane anchor protein n=1 Tax=Massilia sp. NP310 TaxID=2861282 RepID=UPI001C628576|nr:transmembrane anchor protein [Massilia sp. NP310]QYG02795.1 transmembrane anchor protein [Massilia sp. NP310]
MYNTDMPARADLPSSAKLIRSTVLAILTAAAVLITIVLPAEYGVDPTGIGKALGLKAMGEIKTQLAAEALADAKADALAAAPAVEPSASSQVGQPAAAEPSAKADEITVTLSPGAGTEVKMDMDGGDKVSYAWEASGGKVNHDTHGEPLNGPANAFHRYLKENDVTGRSGELTAQFAGSHGWYWRNRGTEPVTITVKVSGDFKNLKQKS